MSGALVVGGAGFIGSHLVERLLERGPVTVLDDFSSGRRELLSVALPNARCELLEGSLFDADLMARALRGRSVVFHLAANPDARRGLDDTRLDLERGTLAMHAVLEAARAAEVRRLVLTSSGAVYGAATAACREGDLGALPLSLYGASKLASEALLSAYVESFGFQGWIFRLGNVIGARATHGAALDFLTRLRHSPERLAVLGDGTQQKPYVHVKDAVDAMLFGLEHAQAPLNVLNVAPAGGTTVRRLAELCVAHSPHPAAAICYGSAPRGWPGDVPRTEMDASALAGLGYRLERSSSEAAELGVRELAREVFG